MIKNNFISLKGSLSKFKNTDLITEEKKVFELAMKMKYKNEDIRKIKSLTLQLRERRSSID